MIEELDVVALIRSLPEHSLREGEMGTVVMIYGDHAAYEVEFMDGDSPYRTALITLMPDEARLTWKASPVPHAIPAD